MARNGMAAAAAYDGGVGGSIRYQQRGSEKVGDNSKSIKYVGAASALASEQSVL